VLELMGFAWRRPLGARELRHYQFGGTKTRTREGKLSCWKKFLNEAATRVRQTIAEKNPGARKRSAVAEEVGLGAIVFADLSSRRQRDVNFVWEEVLNFDGRTGPYCSTPTPGAFDFTKCQRRRSPFI